MEENNKRKKYILVFGIAFLIIVLVGSAYAFFAYSRSIQAFTLTSQGISAIFTEGSNDIDMNGYPISDSFAISNLNQLDYVDFTVSGNVQSIEEAMTYEIYLTEKAGNTLSSNFIKVYVTDNNNNPVAGPFLYSSLNNTTYPNETSVGKVVFEESKVGTFSESYRLYAWIDENYTQNSVSQTFSFYVNIYAHNDTNKSTSHLMQLVMDQKEEEDSCVTYVNDYDNLENLEVTYLSGPKTGDCAIDFNYVWYSGKLWRITAIYPDGSMKMVTENGITNISYGEHATFENSWLYNWFNQEFAETLVNYGTIVDSTKRWDATLEAANTPTKPSGTTLVSSKAGLLNTYEYYKSYQNTTRANGYLRVVYYWEVLTPAATDNVHYITYNGAISYGASTYSATTAHMIRPAIYVKPGVSIESGNGTVGNPYIFASDIPVGTSGTMLNSRVSGEYINFDGDLYRIIGVEDNKTKIVRMDYLRDGSDAIISKDYASSKTFGDPNNTQSDSYWDYYLNYTWKNSISTTYKNMLVPGTYYLGEVSARNYKAYVCSNPSTSDNLKNCAKVSRVYNGYVGLLRYGEMFATQQPHPDKTVSPMWLLSQMTNDTSIVVLNSYSNLVGRAIDNSDVKGVRPTLYLNPNVTISSGSGTISSPYEITMS